MKLCALSDVKIMLDISDTSQDAKLNLMIDRASALAVQYLGYNPARKTYTSEKHAVNGRQYLQLNAQPVQSITSVLLAGSAVTDYGTESSDLAVGLLYRGLGWCGSYYVRGMTDDPVAGVRDIAVTYVAGWFLPGDVGYVADADNSLPYAIQSAIMQSVIESYRINSASAEGVKSHSEGDMSDTWGNAGDVSKALSESVRSALAPFARMSVA